MHENPAQQSACSLLYPPAFAHATVPGLPMLQLTLLIAVVHCAFNAPGTPECTCPMHVLVVAPRACLRPWQGSWYHYTRYYKIGDRLSPRLWR